MTTNSHSYGDHTSIGKNQVHEATDVPVAGVYRAWEPTPGNQRHPNVGSMQDAALQQAQTILELYRPSHLSNELFKFVELFYYSREANRNVKNIDSYRCSQIPLEEIGKDSVLSCIHEEAMAGRASVHDLLYYMHQVGMPSIELAKLTHIYGHRLEHLPAMRSEIVRAIVDHGGAVTQDKEVFEIIDSDRSITMTSTPKHGIAMKRKRRIGIVKDIVVLERLSFIVRIDDESKLSGDITSAIKKTEVKSDESRQSLLHSGLEDEVKLLLKNDDLETIIPLSTTTYATKIR